MPPPASELPYPLLSRIPASRFSPCLHGLLGSTFNHHTPNLVSLVNSHNITNTAAVTPKAIATPIQVLLWPCAAVVPTTPFLPIPASAPLEIKIPVDPALPALWLPIPVSLVTSEGPTIPTLSEPTTDDTPTPLPPSGAPFSAPTSLPLESGGLESPPVEVPSPPSRFSLSPELSPLPPFQDGVPMLSVWLLPAQVHTGSAEEGREDCEGAGAMRIIGIVVEVPEERVEMRYDVETAEGDSDAEATLAEDDGLELRAMSCSSISPRFPWNSCS